MGNLKKIPIFFTFNNDYVVPAAVAFDSLLRRAFSDVAYQMFVIHSDISLGNQNLLHQVVNDCGTEACLTFIDSQGFLQDEWQQGNFEGHNQNTQFTVDTIIRCFAASFFPQFDKIIYSDVDVVFMDDISELYEVDLAECYIAGVKSAFMRHDANELSHLSAEHYEKLKDSYFAGGIWLMNLAQIRHDQLETRMLSIVRDPKIVKRWNDQDVMNIACDNRVAYVSLRYISYPYLQDRMSELGFVSHYSTEELLESIDKPKILHFAGVKPWNAFPNKRQIWWDHFERLGLPRTRIFDRPISWKYRMYFKLWQKLSKKLRDKGIIQ